MITLWPYPGSATVSCGIGEHKCRGDSCSCIATCKATRYRGDATDDGQEIRFEAFVKQAFGVKVK